MPTLADAPLTEDQQEAYDRVYDRLDRGERYTGLRGYAGTGKTYLVSRLVEELLEEDCQLSVCAPTHKAVQVLSQELGDAPVQMQTLHSFLGLRLQPTEGGEYELVAEEEQDFTEGVVIVDEASMIGREEWQHIEASPMWVQWLFVGDPAQLPPVNEDPSPALDVPGPTLETIHRQAADSPILDLAHALSDEALRFEDFERLVEEDLEDGDLFAIGAEIGRLTIAADAWELAESETERALKSWPERLRRFAGARHRPAYGRYAHQPARFDEDLGTVALPPEVLIATSTSPARRGTSTHPSSAATVSVSLR